MEFTKEQLIKTANAEIAEWEMAIERCPDNAKYHQWLRLAEIAMAALMTPKQEPVADVVAWSSPSEERTCDIRWRRHDVKPGPLYTAPSVLVVQDEVRDAINRLLDSDGSRGTFNAVRSYDAREELERLLSAAPKEEIRK